MGRSGSLGSVGSLLPALLPVPGFLGLVGFDAADVVWGALHERVHQVVGLFLVQGLTSVASEGVVGAQPLPSPEAAAALQPMGHTLILEPAVVGRPFLSESSFSGKSIRMKPLEGR